MSKTLKYHCHYKCKFLKTKSYWIIDNSDYIHRDIKQLNNKKKASTIYSYDFTKLYTNIPHGMLKDNIIYVIEKAFKIKEYPDFIKVNMKSATFAKKKPDKTNIMYLNKDDVLSLLEYLLNNIYVKYRDNIFRQAIGVPMGTDCAPDLANLFLFAFEYKYIIGLIDVKSDDIKRFKFIYRYIDDLLVLNDNEHFDSVYTDIYPQALELKYTARSRTNASFLDMDISINNSIFSKKLFDKRNEFNFNVISLPNMSNNIPINQAYSTYYSQIIRYFKANNNYSNFVNNVKCLYNKLCKQNFNKRLLLKYLKLFICKYEPQLIAKFLTILYALRLFYICCTTILFEFEFHYHAITKLG